MSFAQIAAPVLVKKRQSGFAVSAQPILDKLKPADDVFRALDEVRGVGTKDYFAKLDKRLAAAPSKIDRYAELIKTIDDPKFYEETSYGERLKTIPKMISGVYGAIQEAPATMDEIAKTRIEEIRNDGRKDEADFLEKFRLASRPAMNALEVATAVGTLPIEAVKNPVKTGKGMLLYPFQYIGAVLDDPKTLLERPVEAVLLGFGAKKMYERGSAKISGERIVAPQFQTRARGDLLPNPKNPRASFTTEARHFAGQFFRDLQKLSEQEGVKLPIKLRNILKEPKAFVDGVVRGVLEKYQPTLYTDLTKPVKSMFKERNMPLGATSAALGAIPRNVKFYPEENLENSIGSATNLKKTDLKEGEEYRAEEIVDSEIFKINPELKDTKIVIQKMDVPARYEIFGDKKIYLNPSSEKEAIEVYLDHELQHKHDVEKLGIKVDRETLNDINSLPEKRAYLTTIRSAIEKGYPIDRIRVSLERVLLTSDQVKHGDVEKLSAYFLQKAQSEIEASKKQLEQSQSEISTTETAAKNITFKKTNFFGKTEKGGGNYEFLINNKLVGHVTMLFKRTGERIGEGGLTFPKGRDITQNTAFVDSYEIKESMQGKGLGREVWQKIEQIARDAEMEKIELTSVQGTATGFWEKMGYEPSKKYPLWEKYLDAKELPTEGISDANRTLASKQGKRQKQTGDISQIASRRIRKHTNPYPDEKELLPLNEYADLQAARKYFKNLEQSEIYKGLGEAVGGKGYGNMRALIELADQGVPEMQTLLKDFEQTKKFIDDKETKIVERRREQKEKEQSLQEAQAKKESKPADQLESTYWKDQKLREKQQEPLTPEQKGVLLTQMNVSARKKYDPKFDPQAVIRLEQSGKAEIIPVEIPAGKRVEATFALEGNKEKSYKPFVFPLIWEAIQNGKNIYIDVNSGGATVVKMLPKMIEEGLEEAHLNFFDREKYVIQKNLQEHGPSKVIELLNKTDQSYRRGLMEALTRSQNKDVREIAKEYLKKNHKGIYDKDFLEWYKEYETVAGEKMPQPLRKSKFYEGWRKIMSDFHNKQRVKPNDLITAVKEMYLEKMASRGSQPFVGVAGLSTRSKVVEKLIGNLKEDAAAYKYAQSYEVKVQLHTNDGKKFVHSMIKKLTERNALEKAVMYTDPPYIRTTATYDMQQLTSAAAEALTEYASPKGVEEIYKPALEATKQGMDLILTNDINPDYFRRLLKYDAFSKSIPVYRENTTPTSLLHTLSGSHMRLYESTERYKAVAGYEPENTQADKNYTRKVKQTVKYKEWAKYAEENLQKRDITMALTRLGHTSLTAERVMEILEGGIGMRGYREIIKPTYDSAVEMAKELNQIKMEVDAFGVLEGSMESKNASIYAQKIEFIRATEKEKNLAAYARQKYDELLDRMNKVRKKLGIEPIKKHADYITHLRDLNALIELFGSLDRITIQERVSKRKQQLLQRYADWDEVQAFEVAKREIEELQGIEMYIDAKQPAFRFVKQRKGEFEKNPDIIRSFSAYIEPAMRYIHQAENVARNKAYKDALPANAKEFFRIWNTEQVGGRTFSKFMTPAMRSSVSALRGTLGANTILGNAGVMIMQLTSWAQVYAFAGTRNLLYGVGTRIGSYLNENSGMYQHSRTRALRNLETDIGLGDSLLDKLLYRIGQVDSAKSATTKARAAIDVGRHLLMSVMEGFDQFTVGATFETFLHKGIKDGLEIERAMDYADVMTGKTQANYFKEALPPFLNTVDGKAFGQFGTYGMNQFQMMIRDFGKEYEWNKTSPKQKRTLLKHFIKFLVAAYIVDTLSEGIFGRQPYEVKQLADETARLIVGEGSPRKWLDTAKDTTTNYVPFLSSVKYGSMPPVFEFGGDVLNAIFADGERRKKSLKALTEKWSFNILLPYAGTQMRKTAQGTEAVFNIDLPFVSDPSKTVNGNERYDLNGVLEEVKALFFSPNATNGAREYFDDLSGSTSSQNSGSSRRNRNLRKNQSRRRNLINR